MPDVLASDASEGNQWYNQKGPVQGATDQSFIPASEGEYYVIVSHYGCSSESSNIISIGYDGLTYSGKSYPVRFFPNPFKDVITLESISGYQAIEFELVNILGHVLHKGTFTNKISIRTDHLPSGIYFLKLKMPTAQIQGKSSSGKRRIIILADHKSILLFLR